MQKEEKLFFTINTKKVEVNHNWDVTSGRALGKQTTGLKDLLSFLLEEIENNKTEGFIPYNNFESAINWKIKEAA